VSREVIGGMQPTCRTRPWRKNMKIMNRVGVVLCLVLIATMVESRDGYCEEAASNSDIELLRSDIRTQKAALVADRMHLTNREADAFWPIYRKYEVELAAINDRKISLMKDYLSGFNTLDDAQTRQLARRLLEMDQATADLRSRFFDELEQALPVKTAARWLQLERRLQLFLDAKLAKDVPAMPR
jgi:hypothetical protein